MSYRFLDCKYFKNTFLETFSQRYGINKILWFNDLSFFRQVWKVKLFSNSMLSVCFFGKFYYYQVVIRVDYQPMFWKERALFGSWGDLNRGWLVKIERKIAIYSSVSSSFFYYYFEYTPNDRNLIYRFLSLCCCRLPIAIWFSHYRSKNMLCMLLKMEKVSMRRWKWMWTNKQKWFVYLNTMMLMHWNSWTTTIP